MQYFFEPQPPPRYGEGLRAATANFATHRWPVWGSDRVIALLEDHRDLYKYLHDQTVRMANIGYTPAEIAERIELPPDIAKNWSNHGYYGSWKLGSRGVYQRYLGFYDGNPANLGPLPSGIWPAAMWMPWAAPMLS